MSYINDTYDDRDMTDLKYAGFWFNTGSYNASSVGETGTLSSSSDIHANVTFVFPVPAVAFYYFGIRRCCGGLYAICIDCDPNAPIFDTIDAVNRTDNGENPPVVLFSKTFDQPGIHEVILTNMNDSRFGTSQITIDRFVLEVPNDNPVILPSSTPSPPTSSSSSSSPSSSPSSVKTSSSSSDIAAIAGGVAGGVVCLAILLGILFCIRRRRRHREVLLESGSPSRPRPFYTSPAYDPSVMQEMDGGGVTPFPTVPNYIPSTRRKGSKRTKTASHRPTASSSTNLTGVSSSTVLSDSVPSTRVRRREQDAGRYIETEEEEEEDTLPPDYGEVFRREERNRVSATEATPLAEGGGGQALEPQPPGKSGTQRQ